MQYKQILTNNNWIIYTVLGFATLMLLLTIQSIYYGVSLHDEAFYVAIPYRFVLGDRPFIDEYNIAQLAGFFEYPFIKLYLLWNGDSSSIILFARYLYLMASLLLSGLVYLVFRKVTHSIFALLLGLPSFVFVPFNMHSLSYNTLAMIFFMAGDLFAVLSVMSFKEDRVKNIFFNIHKHELLIFIAGLFHACMVICYPTLFFVPLISFACFSYFTSKMRAFVSYILGGIFGISWLLGIIFHVGIAPLLLDYRYVAAFGTQGGSFHKLLIVIKALWQNMPHKLIIALLVSMMFLLNKYKLPLIVFILSLFLVLLIPEFKAHSWSGAIYFLINIFFLTPFFYVLVRKHFLTKEFFMIIWVPSLIAGLVMGWSSGEGMMNGILGFFPGSIVGLYFLMLACNRTTLVSAVKDKDVEPDYYRGKKGLIELIQFDVAGNGYRKIKIIFSPFALLVPIFFIGALQYFNNSYTYEDAPRKQLNALIENGPFKGVYTIQTVKDYSDQLSSDIKSINNSQQRILFFDDFPAGYLFSSMKPATNTLWLFSTQITPHVDRNATITYFHNQKIEPDYIVKMSNVPSLTFVPARLFYYEDSADPINNMLHSYKLYVTRSGYQIYKKDSNL